MNASIKSKAGRRGWFQRTLVLAALGAVIVTGGLKAQTPAVDTYRIEEDWALVVSNPQYNVDGPQVTCTISPANMASAYCAFDLNYHTQPDYQAGGLQIHTWDPASPIEYANSVHTGVMATSGETVTWTQTMTLDPSTHVITFQVINGQSQTWGTFGGMKGGINGNLMLGMTTSFPNLNLYDMNVSLDNSGVSFASNLVVSQTLMAVRWFDSTGKLIQQVTTPQIVHPQQ